MLGPPGIHDAPKLPCHVYAVAVVQTAGAARPVAWCVSYPEYPIASPVKPWLFGFVSRLTHHGKSAGETNGPEKAKYARTSFGDGFGGSDPGPLIEPESEKAQSSLVPARSHCTHPTISPLWQFACSKVAVHVSVVPPKPLSITDHDPLTSHAGVTAWLVVVVVVDDAMVVVLPSGVVDVVLVVVGVVVVLAPASVVVVVVDWHAAMPEVRHVLIHAGLHRRRVRADVASFRHKAISSVQAIRHFARDAAAHGREPTPSRRMTSRQADPGSARCFIASSPSVVLQPPQHYGYPRATAVVRGRGVHSANEHPSSS